MSGAPGIPPPIPPLAGDPRRLATLAAYGILGTGAEAEFDGIALLARTLCAAPTALVSFVAKDRQWFKARSGFGPAQTPLSQSVCAHVLGETGVLVIPDLLEDPRTRENTLVTGRPKVRFYAGAPLRAPDGQALGAVCVLDTVPRPGGLSPQQAEGLQVLARLAMALLRSHRRGGTGVPEEGGPGN